MRYLWFMIFACAGCIDKRDRSNHFVNSPICDGLYTIEKFRVYHGGVHAGDSYSDYVTDSMTFRTYIGVHDDASGYIYNCSEGILSVEKFVTSISGTPTIEAKYHLRIDSLRKADPL